MATEAQQCLKVSYPAGADLSGLQYTAVKLNASGQAVGVAAATDRAVGILQNKPKAAGQMAEIVVVGVTKIVSGGAIPVGSNVSFTATGKAQAPGTGVNGFGGAYVQATQQVVGYLYAQAAAANNDVTSAVVNFTTPLPAS